MKMFDALSRLREVAPELFTGKNAYAVFLLIALNMFYSQYNNLDEIETKMATLKARYEREVERRRFMEDQFLEVSELQIKSIKEEYYSLPDEHIELNDWKVAVLEKRMVKLEGTLELVKSYYITSRRPPIKQVQEKQSK